MAIWLPEEVDSLRDSGLLSTAHDAATANFTATQENSGWNPMLQSYVVKWMSVENAGQVVFFTLVQVLIPKF